MGDVNNRVACSLSVFVYAWLGEMRQNKPVFPGSVRRAASHEVITLALNRSLHEEHESERDDGKGKGD